MSELTFDCPACADEIDPDDVLVALARQGAADAVIEEQADVEIQCPECQTAVTLGAAEVLVKLSADDATLAIFSLLAETDGTIREPDWEQVIEREREARERREEIRETLETLKESLDTD